MSNTEMHKLNLSFHKDQELEKEFIAHYTEDSKKQVFTGTLSGIPTIGLFFLVDYFIFPEVFGELFKLRMINMTLIVGLVIYSFGINKKSNFMFYISFLGPLFSAIMQTHILAIGYENIHLMHFPGMMLILMYNYMFLRQRFYHALISSLILSVYFMVTFSGTTLFHTSDFFLMAVFFHATMFIGLATSYVLEQSTRSAYLMTKSLKKAGDDRKEIYKVVVHDLKNPVSIIKSQIHLLQAANKIEDKYSKRIFNSTDRMLYLLDHLLKFCALEEKQMVAEFDEFNIKEIMDICIENNSLAAETKKIILNHKIEKGIDFITNLDGFKTQEVFDNIISNAVKYAPINSTVDISYRENGESYIIEIKDFGQGIKEPEVSKVFDKFTKLSSVPTAGENSNGLGLSLSKNLMEVQGGTITCQSKYGKWTLFTIYIPRRDQTQTQVA